MSSLKPQTFTYILIAVLAGVLLVGGAGYYFGIRYIQTESASLRAKMGQLEATNERLAQLTRAKRQYDRDVKPNAELINAALPQSKSQSEVLAQLQRVAAQNGLSISSIQLPSPVGLPGPLSQTVKAGKAGRVLALPITFKIQGTYAQLQSFLRGVENLGRFTNVTSLSVSQRPDPSRPIEYAITLNAYILP